MNVSRNELTAVLKRLFEYLDDGNYDYGACADAVAWLEAHEFAGVRSLESVLERLLAKTRVPTQIVSSASDHFEINAGGQSLFALAPVAIDLGDSMLVRSSPFRITITNAVNQLAMISGIHRSSRYSASMAAWWRDADEPVMHLVHGGANGEYPEYQRFMLSADDSNMPVNVTLVCGTDPQHLRDLLPVITSMELIERIDAGAFAERHARTLEAGIEVDASSFEKLWEVADRVVVESTDSSRSGAGE